MQFSLVMRNECEDAERWHRSRNCFLDYCPSVSWSMRTKKTSNVFRPALTNYIYKILVCKYVGVGAGGVVVKKLWEHCILYWSNKSDNYFRVIMDTSTLRALKNSAANKLIKSKKIFQISINFLCIHRNPLLLPPFFPREDLCHAMVWEMLELLFLNSQLILEKMRITLVKQTRQSQFLHHRTLTQTETGRWPKVLRTFSKRQPNTKATISESGKSLIQ